jgi:hypothetical protein
MDRIRFDTLARSLTRDSSRRGVLRLLTGDCGPVNCGGCPRGTSCNGGACV